MIQSDFAVKNRPSCIAKQELQHDEVEGRYSYGWSQNLLCIFKTLITENKVDNSTVRAVVKRKLKYYCLVILNSSESDTWHL